MDEQDRQDFFRWLSAAFPDYPLKRALWAGFSCPGTAASARGNLQSARGHQAISVNRRPDSKAAGRRENRRDKFPLNQRGGLNNPPLKTSPNAAG